MINELNKLLLADA